VTAIVGFKWEVNLDMYLHRLNAKCTAGLEIVLGGIEMMEVRILATLYPPLRGQK